MVKMNDAQMRQAIKETLETVKKIELILEGRPGNGNSPGLIMRTDRLERFKANACWAFVAIGGGLGTLLLDWARTCLFSH